MSLVVQTGDGNHSHSHSIPTPHAQLSGQEAAALIGSEAIIKTGWLYKRGGRTKAWKKRWFVLRKDRLAYYKDETEYETRRVVQIDDVSGVSSKASSKRSTISFYIRDRQAHLQTESQQSAEEWTDKIKLAIKLNEIQHSLPTSPVDIKSGRTGQVPQIQPEIGQSCPPGSLDPQISSIGAQIPVSRSMAFSDDDLSPALMSDEDFTSPLSEVSTFHDEIDNTIPPQNETGSSLPSDKVIIQGFLRRHHLSRSLRSSAKLWAVLRPHGLFLYPDEKEYRTSKVISFGEMIDAIDLPSSDEHSGSHQPKKGITYRFQVITREKALRFSVSEEKTLHDWLGALKSRLEMKEFKARQS